LTIQSHLKYLKKIYTFIFYDFMHESGAQFEWSALLRIKPQKPTLNKGRETLQAFIN